MAGGTASHLGTVRESSGRASEDDNSTPRAAETDKFRFLSWLRLLLFQLMLDIIEVFSFGTSDNDKILLPKPKYCPGNTG